MVVCVNADNLAFRSLIPARFEIVGGLDGLLKGDVYTVRDIGVEFGFVCIRLKEIIRPVSPYTRVEAMYAAARFRPVKETSIDVFTQMLVSTPVLADA